MPGNFFCASGATLSLTVVTTSNRVSLGDVANSGSVVRVSNTNAAQPVGIRFGDSTVVAVLATDMVIASNAVEYFVIPGQATHLAAIASAPATALKVTLGSV